MAIPATASTPMLSSQSMSSSLVTPPAAVTARVVARRTRSIASRSSPCISPSTSTLVNRNSPKYCSSSRTASTGVIGSCVRHPSIATRPPRASTAAIRLSGDSASASSLANRTFTRPPGNPRNNDEPTITLRAPPSSTARARSSERIPPPTRQGSCRQMPATIAPLSPSFFDASRSISCTFSKRAKRAIQPSKSSVATASRSPWTSWTMRPPCRSIEGMSISDPYRHIVLPEELLEIGDGVLAEVKDRRRQCGIRAAGREDVEKVIEGAGAARRDDWDADRTGDRRRQLAIEPAASAVAIDGREKHLAGAAICRLARPLDRFAIRAGASAASAHREAPVGGSLRIDRHDDRLRAVARCQAREQWRIVQRGAVERDLVGARVQRGGSIVLGANAASDREGDEELRRYLAQRVFERAALFDRCRDVEHGELVDSFRVVPLRQLPGITGDGEVLELHALHDAAVAHVEARDEALR